MNVGVDFGKVDGNRGNDGVGNIRNGTEDGPLEELSVPWNGRQEQGRKYKWKGRRKLLKVHLSPLFKAICGILYRESEFLSIGNDDFVAAYRLGGRRADESVGV